MTVLFQMACMGGFQVELVLILPSIICQIQGKAVCQSSAALAKFRITEARRACQRQKPPGFYL
jgi:hypothetical protein